MKKTLSFLLFTILTVPVFAQTYSLGIKGGLNFSTQTDDPNSVGILRGFNVGVIYNIQYENWAIQPGAFFSSKGVKENLHVIDQTTSATRAFNQDLKFNYIEFPFNTVYKFPSKSDIHFYLGGGPYLAYAISGWVFATGQPRIDLSFDDYLRVDFGLTAIGGVELQRRIIIGFNYDLGVTSVSQLQTHSGIANRTLGLSVGYLFR